MSEKTAYFLKLKPPRRSFMKDMTEEERAVMARHVNYWAPYVQDGTVIVLGPVMDPKGGYGISVTLAESDEKLKALIENDPALTIGSKYEWHPMRAVTRAFSTPAPKG